MRVWSPEDKRWVRARFDASRLPPGIWFVRSGKGNGYMPVTREGNRIMAVYFFSLLGFAIVGGVMAGFIAGVWWVLVVAAGFATASFWFFRTVMRHGDRSINYTDVLVKEPH